MKTEGRKNTITFTGFLLKYTHNHLLSIETNSWWTEKKKKKNGTAPDQKDTSHATVLAPLPLPPATWKSGKVVR